MSFSASTAPKACDDIVVINPFQPKSLPDLSFQPLQPQKHMTDIIVIAADDDDDIIMHS